MTGGDTLGFQRNLTQTPVSDAEREAQLVNPGFGKVFTEHMVTVRYADSKGWYDARVEPFGPIPMSPATAVLHYAQEIFEGMKAYRTEAGITLFRPEANARRFRDSARRMAMPEIPEELFLQAIRELVAVDEKWIPGQPESSLYLRPYMIASEVFLGVRPSAEYLFGVIACPVGAYFKGGPKPIKLWISEEYTRAAPGGTGAAKCGGNYATSLVAQAEATREGCDQVVFLDTTERKYVDELGGMNIFFVYDDGTLVTPPLGTILPGITRDSIMTLAREAGHQVVERPYSVDEWRADAANGRLREVFACGTAAVVTPVGTLRSASGEFTVADGQPGEVTLKLRSQLLDIQQGRATDTHGWVQKAI
ncbi:branched-chain amino acid aminotransferase [Longispora sp. K20-0274]|uniref:branched-chain amino acid aminotransferase n=1 Tax=Longispora sp. K20-0274 TaxID=3088255 RepID=UPI00399BE0C2